MSSIPSTRPAPPPPKPGKVKVFRAMYKYSAQQPDELSFDEGDIIYINDTADLSGGWWQARCNGKLGLIPSNYGEVMAPSPPLNSSLIVCGDYVCLYLQLKNPLNQLIFLCMKQPKEVSVNSLDKSGSTPVYWAAHGGHIEILKQLLSIPNVNFSAQNKIGDTALHAAAWKGHTACVQELIVKGANLYVKNKDGKTALQICKNPETAAYLKRASTAVSPKYFEDYQLSDGSDEGSD